jgi:hypothetical protein
VSDCAEGKPGGGLQGATWSGVTVVAGGGPVVVGGSGQRGESTSIPLAHPAPRALFFLLSCPFVPLSPCPSVLIVFSLGLLLM